ncbi:MAG: hypothetical protein NT099_09025 [Candidatus Saganbacteria bacterium]|nr:hypothetical protein [Candidatus Saganbacteria bacterium]
MSLDKEGLSSDEVLSKLQGANPQEQEKALDFVICDPTASGNSRYIPHLLNLMESNDPTIRGKAMMAVVLLQENEVSFTLEQNERYDKYLSGATVVVDKGVLKIRTRQPSITLPNGASLQNGQISFDGKNWYVAAGDVAEISGVRIAGGKEDLQYDVRLYFDGEEHAGYIKNVSINIGKKQLVCSGEFNNPYSISLYYDNPFMRFDLRDRFYLTIEGNTSIVIKSRNKDGLIPEIYVKTDSREGAIIRSGILAVVVGGNGQVEVERQATIATEDPCLTSTPFSLRLLDNSGQQKAIAVSARECEAPARPGFGILLNNYGEPSILGATTNEESAVPCYPPFVITERNADNYMKYGLDEFRERYPQIEYSGPVTDQNIKYLLDYLETLPPKVQASIKAVRVLSNEEEMEKHHLAEANNEERKMYFKATELTMPVFQHEGAHILTFALEDEKSDFVDRWKAIAGEVYGQVINTADGPKNGCVRPYGETNYYEDIATFVEKIWEDPKFFNPLIDPSSPKYDERYVAKIDLLYEYGFISREKYNAVFHVA